MNKSEAEALADDYISFGCSSEDRALQILPDRTIEKEYGWIFFYHLKYHPEEMLLGNGPILVEKSGKMTQFAASFPIEESIRRYEAGLPLI